MKLLSMHEGYLSLNGLENISDNAANALARHNETINIQGLTELSERAAESLARHGFVFCDKFQHKIDRWKNQSMPEDSETEPSVKAQAEGEISNEKFIDNSCTQKAKDLLETIYLTRPRAIENLLRMYHDNPTEFGGVARQWNNVGMNMTHEELDSVEWEDVIRHFSRERKTTSEEQVLTKEIAEQFLANDNSVDLSEFTKIEEAAAESLSKYQAALSLRCLT